MPPPLPHRTPDAKAVADEQPPGTPSAGLLARAENGFVRFLARGEDDDQAEEETTR